MQVCFVPKSLYPPEPVVILLRTLANFPHLYSLSCLSVWAKCCNKTGLKVSV